MARSETGNKPGFEGVPLRTSRSDCDPAALFAQGILQHFVPIGADFPLRVFLSDRGVRVGLVRRLRARRTGVPVRSGRASASTGGFSQDAAYRLSRMVLFVGVSLLISRTAQTQRRAREVLRVTNDELDRRVKDERAELVRAVEQLQAEIAGHQQDRSRASRERGARGIRPGSARASADWIWI